MKVIICRRLSPSILRHIAIYTLEAWIKPQKPSVDRAGISYEIPVFFPKGQDEQKSRVSSFHSEAKAADFHLLSILYIESTVVQLIYILCMNWCQQSLIE
jgi:hypothetical protein